MIEPLSVFLFVAGLLYGTGALCHAVARWSLRTPGSGYLIYTIFLLFILIRSLP